MLIYKVTNILNDKCYVGQTIKTLKQRQTNHINAMQKGSKFHFHLALRKYGLDNFKWEILETVTDKSILTERETYWITNFDSYNKGYNMTKWGQQNPMLSEKVKRKHLKSVQSKEFKAKLREANTGRLLTEETKKKLSKQKLGKKNPMYGKTPTNARKLFMLDPTSSKVLKEFKSGTAANNYLIQRGLTKSSNAKVNILHCARTNKGIKYGYKWTFNE
jgi:group I intron endonuclease